MRRLKNNFHKRFPDLGLDSWLPGEKEIEEAIDAATKSAPGPDRVPFEAFNTAKELSVKVLHAIVKDMFTDPNWEPPSFFNNAWLALLPKKPKLVCPNRGDVYSPGNLRPLSIVGTFNRLIANAMRAKLAPLLEQVIGEIQQGFMKDRSIIFNVLKIDLATMQVSLNHPRGRVVLFDFTTAFPSVSHDYMWQIMEHMNAPPEFIRACKWLYHDNHHSIRAHGQVFDSVVVSSGIRQDCPISPLLFLICIEPLLDRLRNDFPNSTFGAYADDIGAVIQDVPGDLPGIISVFEEFAAVSGLYINVEKIVLIPAKPNWSPEIKRDDQQMLQATNWGNMPIVGSSKYLGFFLGPDTKWDQVYTSIVNKMEYRLQRWSNNILGLFDKIRLWNIFISSLLSYTDQLAMQPDEISERILSLMKKAYMRYTQRLDLS